MGRMQKDDERAREESGSRDDLQRKLRARDDRITVLEEALRDICDRCETWPNPGDSEALLRAKALLD